MRLSVCVWLAISFAWSALAHAQPSTPPDIVVLRSGEMARGTVMQVVPGEHVVLALPDGSTRSFAAGEVRYAGPAAGAPSSGWIQADDGSPVEPVASPAERRLEVVEVDPGEGTVRLEIHATPGVHVAAARLDLPHLRLCAAPCVARILPGNYRFGIVEDDRFRLEIEPRVVSHDALLTVRYSSRRVWRILGAAVVAVSLVGAVIGAIGGIANAVNGNPGGAAVWFTGGGLGLSIALGVGLPPAALSDLFEIRLGE